jgi:hypothetical protein
MAMNPKTDYLGCFKAALTKIIRRGGAERTTLVRGDLYIWLFAPEMALNMHSD